MNRVNEKICRSEKSQGHTWRGHSKVKCEISQDYTCMLRFICIPVKREKSYSAKSGGQTDAPADDNRHTPKFWLRPKKIHLKLYSLHQHSGLVYTQLHVGLIKQTHTSGCRVFFFTLQIWNNVFQLGGLTVSLCVKSACNQHISLKRNMRDICEKSKRLFAKFSFSMTFPGLDFIFSFSMVFDYFPWPW